MYEIKVKEIDGSMTSLEAYKGKVLLIVNTATGCGLTPQYPGLEKLYKDYKEDGFEILDFPCNQFANQASESNEEIHTICTGRFGITFKQFAKINVNGKNQSDLYKYLKKNSKGLIKTIKWNFTKFLVDREGNVVKRFGPTVKPEEIEEDIKKLMR